MKKRINSKRKGNNFELKIAKEIAKEIGVEYGKYIRRTPGSGALLTRADLWVDEKYRAKFPYFCELKKRRTALLDKITQSNWEPKKWFDESMSKLEHCPSYGGTLAPPILIFANNNTSAFVMFDREYWNNHAVPAEVIIKSTLHNVVIIDYTSFLNSLNL